MKIEWKPAENAVAIEGAGEWSWRTPEAAELKAFDFELERAAMVYGLLEDARDSFRDGRAKYENACEEARHLITESNKAAVELLTISKCVGDWMFPVKADPMDEQAKISDAFEGDANGLVAFARQWIQHQGHPEQVVKNSSRELLGKSAPELPKTAKNASDSSSTLKTESSDSDSKPENESTRRIAPVAT